MGDACPRQSEHSREAGEWSIDELRQLPIEPRGQIRTYLADLLLDEVIIVQQPFGGRRYRAAFADRCSDRAICGEQGGLVVLQSGDKGAACRSPSRNLLGCGKTRGMLLETLAAEEFGADDLVAVPRRDRRSVYAHCRRPV